MNVIETHALAKSYGQTRALDDCTLAIPEGHVVALGRAERCRKDDALESRGRSRSADER